MNGLGGRGGDENDIPQCSQTPNNVSKNKTSTKTITTKHNGYYMAEHDWLNWSTVWEAWVQFLAGPTLRVITTEEKMLAML